MTTTLSAAWRLAALSATLLLQAPAQAGLISGSWDPEFGPPLPGLSWAVQADVLAPNDGCTDGSGDRSTVGSGPCAGAKIQAVFLRLYDSRLAAPDWTTDAAYRSGDGAKVFALCDSTLGGVRGSYATRCGNDERNYGNFFTLTSLRIANGSAIGLAGTVDVDYGAIGQPASAGENSFRLAFTLDRPQLSCLTCGDGGVVSSGDGLRQFLVTYNSNDTSDPKFRNAAGQALGVQLDASGQVIGLATSIAIDATAVPEPGSLGLAAAALAGAALLRRRRRS